MSDISSSSIDSLFHSLEIGLPRANLSNEADYLLHSSSIPLTGVADTSFLLSKEGHSTVEWKHKPFGSDGCASPRCIARDKHGQRHDEGISSACQCMELLKSFEQQPGPICFLEVMARIQSKVEDDVAFKTENIVVCYNHESITSCSYGAAARTWIGVSSFQNISRPDEMKRALSMLWWFRSKPRTRNLLKKHTWLLDDMERFKRKLKQAMFTTDSFLVKILMCFPKDTSYSDIADMTDRSMATLLQEYFAPVELVDGIPKTPPGLFYNDLVNFTKMCKHGIQFPTKTWLLYEGASETFKFTLGSVLKAAHQRLEELSWLGKGRDNSISFLITKILFGQKRSIGHVPDVASAQLFSDFREELNKPYVEWSESKQRYVAACLRDELLEQIPGTKDIFRKEPEDSKILAKISSQATVELKNSADVDETVENGGKLRVAQILVAKIRENDWQIPIRSLESGKIIGYTDYDDIGDDGLGTVLFWLSLQLVVNELHSRGKVSSSFYYELKDKGEIFKFNPFRARILHVPEAAKVRDLIKTSVVYGMSISLCGLLLQGVLANSPAHRVGLEGSNDAWNHYLRICSEEGDFLYDTNGKLKENAVNTYLDLTHSTDKLVKVFGCIMLRVLFLHTGFFKWYGQISLLTYCEPMEITEAVFYTVDTRLKFDWKGTLFDGTPMGMQLAKPLLHTTHFAVIGIVRKKLAKRGKRLVIKSGPIERPEV